MDKVSKDKIKGVMSMIEQKINSPLTSSCGRLFDAVSFITGLSPLEVEYEAEAPLRLESVASEEIEENYRFSVEGNSPPFQISFAQTIKSVIKNLEQKTSTSIISARFHNTLVRVIVSMAERAKRAHDIDTVVFAGGVFLNEKLLHRATGLLEKKGFNVLRPLFYSPNDESISIGQIAYALNKLKMQGKPG
jgi:hydrogenase maturation protein HypF